MKKFEGTVNINSTTKSWRTIHFDQSEGPIACNCIRTTNKNSFGTNSVATQQLLTCCPDRVTRFNVQY